MFLNSLRTYLGFESHPLRSAPLQTKGLLVIFRNRPPKYPPPSAPLTSGGCHPKCTDSPAAAAMAQQRATLSTLRAHALIDALREVITAKTADDPQRTVQPEMMKAIQAALDARRQRIVVSQSAVGRIKWARILLQGLCTLIAMPWFTATSGSPAQ